jgi:hypothetical protein
MQLFEEVKPVLTQTDLQLLQSDLFLADRQEQILATVWWPHD